MNEALEIDPGDFYANARRGRLHFSKRRYDHAIADFTRTLAIRPGIPKSSVGAGEAYLARKEFARGFADCEASLVALPDEASPPKHPGLGLCGRPAALTRPRQSPATRTGAALAGQKSRLITTPAELHSTARGNTARP